MNRISIPCSSSSPRLGKIIRLTGPLFLVLAIFSLCTPPPAAAIRLKDIAAVKGVRSNQLVGYGLVVGLDGTGDGNQAAFTSLGLINMLENLGVHLGQNNVNVKNVAGVMVTAKLPPFAKAGNAIDVTISSLGDATSLQGGTLIATPLKGLDGNVYAIAQGPMSIGGFEVAAGGGGGGAQKNHLTVGRIPGGATVEREVPVSFAGKEMITLSLDRADFTTISRTVAVIDSFLDGHYANARDGATVDISVPERFKKDEVAFLAAIENLEVMPDNIARVILDERTGTVVMGENVRINQIAISHGNLSLQVKAEPNPETAAADSAAPTVVSSPDQVNRLITLRHGITLGEVVKALNAIGVTPRDLIAIFQSIKAAGALQADLEII